MIWDRVSVGTKICGIRRARQETGKNPRPTAGASPGPLRQNAEKGKRGEWKDLTILHQAIAAS